MGANVRLLGRFSVVGPDGREVESWPRPAARRLVQLILLEPGRGVSRDRAADLLFTDAPPDRAFRQLSKALSQARSALAAASPALSTALAADTRSIHWAADVSVAVDLDAHTAMLQDGLGRSDPTERATTLAAALRTTDPLLPDDAYESWVADSAGRLEALRQRARIALAEALSTVTRGVPGGEVVGAWRDAFRHDTTDESACAALMAAYASTGDRAQIVRVYRACVAALRADVGVAPSPHLIGAYDAALRRVAPAAAPVGVRPRLFGREAEVSTVVDAVRKGDGVLLVGPAGIGKTSVLAEACSELAEQGWLVLRGTSVPEDELSPFAALRSALAPHLPPAIAGPELSAVLHGTAIDVTNADGRDERLSDAVAAALARLGADRPVVLTLDDVHWADAALALLLRRLSSRTGTSVWTLLVAGRSDEPARPLPAFPTAMRRLELAPLSAEAAAALVASVAGPEVDPSRVMGRAAGNPFFLTELARGGIDRLADDVPRPVRDLVDHRLSACGAEAARLAALIAVAAEDASYDVVLGAGRTETVSGSDDKVMQSLDELLDHHLVVEAADGVRVAHPLLREALLRRTNAVRRSNLHQLVSSHLSPHTDQSFARARHDVAAFRCSRLSSTARPAAVAGLPAGRQARALCANDVALDLLAAALEAFEMLAPTERRPLRPAALDAWITVGDIRLDRGDLTQAAEAYEQALGLVGDDDERQRAWSAMAGVPYTAGDLGAAAATYEQGLSMLVDVSPIPRARLQSDLGWVALRLGDQPAAISLLEQALPVLEGADDAVGLTRCLDRLSLANHSLGRPEEALDLSDRAFVADAASDDVATRGVLLMHRSILLREAGRLDEALDDAREAVELHRQLSRRYLQSVALGDTANVHEARGEWAEALEARDVEREILVSLGNARHLATCDERRAALLAKLGRAGEAADAARAVAVGPAVDDLIPDPGRATIPRPRARSRGNTAGTART